MVWPKNFVGAEVMLRVVPCWSRGGFRGGVQGVM